MARPRLLVVDDDPYTRAALAELFRRQGWDVALAATLAQGVAGLDPAPDCVILDLNLPDGPGEAILYDARTRCPATRFVVCSGIDDAARLARVRRLNPELLLWKPIDLGPVFQLCAGVRTRAS